MSDPNYLMKKLGFHICLKNTNETLLRMAEAPNEATVKSAPGYWMGYFTALREAGELISKQELAE